MCPVRLLANGGNVFFTNDLEAWKAGLGGDARRNFPPELIVQVKALACEIPRESGVPLSRYSISEIQREIISRGITAEISGKTLWRWLNEDAIRPWYHRSWIFPRDSSFFKKASRVLDLYQGLWEGEALTARDQVVSADEKTSIQARKRIHSSLPPEPGKKMKIESEYERLGAWAYLAAWDVRNARIFGRCESTTGIVPFSRLVKQVMNQKPYRSADRVFWVLDNGSSHRGESCVRRLQKQWPTIIPVHLPVHASWLNQIEIYFSIVQRKVLTPNDFRSLNEVAERLLSFQERYEETAKPFEWKFTKKDLRDLLRRISFREQIAA
jgi:hypothetical protein